MRGGGKLHADARVERAKAAGLQVVMDRCMKIEHARFHGGLNFSVGRTAFFQSNIQEPELRHASGASARPFLTGFSKIYHAMAFSFSPGRRTWS